MRKVFKTVLSLSLFIFVVSLALAPRAEAGTGQTVCLLGIGKEARSGPDGGFLFSLEFSSGNEAQIGVQPNDVFTIPVLLGESVAITELVPEGFELVDVSCLFDSGLPALVGEDNSVLASCVSPGSEGICTFRNVLVDAIPTLSEWGMIAAAAGLGLAGLFFAVRRRRAKAF